MDGPDVPSEQLPSERAIGRGAVRARGVRRDRLPRHGGLGEAHGARDDGVEDRLAEGLDHPAEHLPAVQRAGVVHRGHNSLNLKLRVKPIAYLVDGVHQQGHSAQGEELALQRDDHAVSGSQRVHGEQAERRLAVDQHVVVVGAAPARAPATACAPGPPR